MRKVNLNPKGIKACDCVIRAIAYSSKQTWEQTYTDLCQLGLKMKRMPNEKQVYEKYLELNGWIKHKQPRTAYNLKYTVDEFIKHQMAKKAIISVAHHLTCIDNYELIDTWNCGHKSIGNYWTKN